MRAGVRESLLHVQRDGVALAARMVFIHALVAGLIRAGIWS